MLYMIKLQKGELWRPQDLRESTDPVSVRVTKGNAWVTFKCSNEDLIYRPGETVALDQENPLIEAINGELDLEVEFLKKAKSFFSKK